ncbi:uncharacterized protein LOC123682214 [Harmonia axyridis]|uniref:uncharacterized protein LOC123682214 n=1 Tax=Harmonia axyridis TaxID=115357 RepID=UPI001E2768B9|nr:uncharacterized protein LOC123682214 [Harmonia axyridis]
MRYLVLFVICVLIFNNVGAKKKKVECSQCETTSPSDACRKGGVSKTCIGKYCFYYTYDEKYKNAFGGMRTKYWWMRGCTTKKKTCKKEGIRNCVICNETLCNTEPLPTLITPAASEGFI